MNKQTKIVCTIGPACESVEILEKMVHAGMNVARLNFSHGTYENHEQLIDNLREVEQRTGLPIAILQDLQGPKIRLGALPKEGLLIEIGEEIVFTTDSKNDRAVPVGFTELHQYVKAGDTMYLDDAKIQVEVLSVSGTEIHTRVVVGGTLLSHKGINLPTSDLSKLDVLTKKDKEDIEFGVAHGVDFIAMSFVMSANDVLNVRHYIKDMQQKLHITPTHDIKIISKIEKPEAIKNIDAIIDATDAIMVARGDLGIELPAEEVPILQKQIIEKTIRAAKPVIVATQMLDSMQKNPHPTRAEVSDVANAVIDHTDAVMLSNESATGLYPVETVDMMARIIRETEKSKYDDVVHIENHHEEEIDNIMTQLSSLLADHVDARLILTVSISGDTARLISRYRPALPILVATNDVRVEHQLNLSWGVYPFLLEPCNSIEEFVDRALLKLQEEQKVKKGERIIVVAGEPLGQVGHINFLEVKKIV